MSVGGNNKKENKTQTGKIKGLGIYIPQGSKDLYSENYKMLMKEIKADANRCSWIGRINTTKITILPRQSTGSKQS